MLRNGVGQNLHDQRNPLAAFSKALRAKRRRALKGDLWVNVIVQRLELDEFLGP